MQPLGWFRIPDIFIKYGQTRAQIDAIRDFLKVLSDVTVSAQGSTGITAEIVRNTLRVSWTGTLPEGAHVVLTATRGTEKAKTIVYINDYANILLADPPAPKVQQTVTVAQPSPKTQATVTVAQPES